MADVQNWRGSIGLYQRLWSLSTAIRKKVPDGGLMEGRYGRAAETMRGSSRVRNNPRGT